MMDLRKIFIVFILTVCVITGFAHTSFSDDSCSKKSEEWYPPSAGPVTAWTAPLCEKGKLLIQPFFFYNRTRGTFNEDGHYKSYKNKETKSQYQEFLFAQYSVTDRLEVDGQGVYQQNLHHVDGKHAASTGFGDSYLFLRFCTLHETKLLPQTTTMFQLKIPTGKYQKAKESKLGTDLMGATSGGGSYEHSYGIILTKRMKPFIFHADFTYSFPIETRVDGVNVKYGSYVNYDFGAEYFLSKGFNLMLECNFFKQGDGRYNGYLRPASDVGYMLICPGIGWSDKKIQTLIAYQRTLAGTNVDVNDSLVFTFTYTF